VERLVLRGRHRNSRHPAASSIRPRRRPIQRRGCLLSSRRELRANDRPRGDGNLASDLRPCGQKCVVTPATSSVTNAEHGCRSAGAPARRQALPCVRGLGNAWHFIASQHFSRKRSGARSPYRRHARRLRRQTTPSRSALGQKRTLAASLRMSALGQISRAAAAKQPAGTCAAIQSGTSVMPCRSAEKEYSHAQEQALSRRSQ
jgi:hypothetical protein